MPRLGTTEVTFRRAAKILQPSRPQLRTNKIIDAKSPRIRIAKPKANPCTLHYLGVNWQTALCGVERRLGQVILTIGSDCPTCLSIAATKPQEMNHGL